MGFGEAIAAGFSNYFKFSGRASRSEYWWFTLFITLMGIVAVLADHAVTPGYAYPDDVGFIELIWNLIIIIPSTSLSVRRLHDVNHSGWWLLLVLTGIGALVILYWTIKKGDTDTNKYGINPLDPTIESELA
jgi:uncharacterized membrane protein YhaH (DUF805 family)